MEFNIPEEQYELNLAQNGSKYLHVIEELDNFLRSKLKYGELSDEQYHSYEAIRHKLFELRENA